MNTHICGDCHTPYEAKPAIGPTRQKVNSGIIVAVGLGATMTRDSTGMIAGIAIIAVGLWYLQHITKPKCPSCGGKKALPIDSPAAKKLTGD